MDKHMLFFKEEGSKIKKETTNTFYLKPSNSIELPYKQFLILFNQIVNSKDPETILGLCFSLSAYVSSNYIDMKNDKSNQFWICLINLGKIINDPLQAFGYCEAVLITSFYCLEIPQIFLAFLLSDQIPTKSVQVTLLITLYMDLPFDFIESNSNVLFPSISDYFLTSSFPIFQILNLYLVNSLKIQAENVLIDFETNLLSSMYTILANDDTQYQMISKPLSKFRKVHPNFFAKSSSFISSKIKELSFESIQDICPLIFLIPTFSEEDLLMFLNTITPIISHYIATQKKLPKILTAAFKKMKNKLDTYSIVMSLYTFCSQIIETEHYPTAIYLISIFLNKFSSTYKRCTLPIIEKIIFGLESNYPIKFPLAFSVYENIELISQMNQGNKSHNSHNHCNESHNSHCKELCDSNCKGLYHSHCDCKEFHDSNCSEEQLDKSYCNENNVDCNNHSGNHNENNQSSNVCTESNETIQIEITENDNNEYSNEILFFDHGQCQTFHFNSNTNEQEAIKSESNTQISETQFSYLLKNRIIPSLITISISNDSMNYHWSFKALRSLVKSNCFDSSALISYWITNSIQLNHSFLKFVLDGIRFNHQSIDLNQLLCFIELQINNNDDLIKLDLLKLILELMKIEQKVSFDLAFNLCKQLMNSNYSKSFVTCSTVIYRLFLITKNENWNHDKIIDLFKPIIDQLMVIAGTEEIEELIRAEVVFQLSLFDFIPFNNLSNFIKNFLNSGIGKVQIIGLILIENYLISFIESKNPNKGDELIIQLFLPIIYSIIPTSNSIDVVNCSYSILITILSSYFPNYKQTIPYQIKDVKIIDIINKSVLIILQGRIILFNHQMPFTYNSLSKNFKFFKYAALYIVKFPKSHISKHIVQDFSLWLLRVSIEIVPKLLNVLEIGCLFNVCDKPIIEFIQTAIISRIDEDNSYFKIVSKSISFLVMLKNKFPDCFDFDVFLAFLEKIWEDNSQDDSIISFLVSIFLQLFSEKSFDVRGNFLIFQEICVLIAKEKFDFKYPQIVDHFLNMHRNNVPFFSFPIHSSLVYVHFLIKPQQVLIEEGFSLDQCKEMHKCLKQNIKINKAAERFLDNYYKNEPKILEQIKLLKKSPQLPHFK